MANGFSSDGYIIDQNCFTGYQYRGMSSDFNGCGWIAAFNFLRGLERDLPFETVLKDMNALFPLQVPGPTPLRFLLRYLRRHTELRFVRGRKAGLSAARKSRAGILRYCESGIPHYVAYIKTQPELYRFFNVADGLEDYSDSMQNFFRTRCRGYIRVITD